MKQIFAPSEIYFCSPPSFIGPLTCDIEPWEADALKIAIDFSWWGPKASGCECLAMHEQ